MIWVNRYPGKSLRCVWFLVSTQTAMSLWYGPVGRVKSYRIGPRCSKRFSFWSAFPSLCQRGLR